jgi:transposase
MRTGRPIAPLSVTAEERERLQEWARRPKTAQALALRSRIVLECAAGQPNMVVAGKLGITHQTVGKWRQRFLEQRLDGLLDEPRPGAPRQVSDAQIERVVRMTLERTPADATHWSTRAMARRSGLSQTAFGGRLPCSRTGSRASSSPKTRCSWKKFATSRVCTSILPTGRWCCAWMRKPRFRRLIAASRCCRCVPAKPSAAARITCVTAPSICLLRSTPRPAR